jgi:hypothetical protein
VDREVLVPLLPQANAPRIALEAPITRRVLRWLMTPGQGTNGAVRPTRRTS